MDLNTIALWLTAIPAVSLFLRSVRGPVRLWGWAAVTALVLLVAGGGYFLFRDVAGYLSAGLAILAIFVPSRASHAAARASKRFLYRRARRYATLAAVLHPFDGWAALPRLFLAFELAHAGRIADAEALLQVLARGTGRIALVAGAQRLRFLERWEELKAFAERAGLRALNEEPTLLVLYLRALGELGEVDTLAEFTLAHEANLTATASLEPALLYLFSFTGQVELTRRVLSGDERGYTDDARRFWIAVAQARAGDSLEALDAFARLKSSSDTQIREGARHYGATLDLTDRVSVSARVRQVVQHFASTLSNREDWALNHPLQRSERVLVSLLIAANAVVYVIGSWPRYIDTADDFVDRWGLKPHRVINDHEWQRAFSYLFVHANALHLIMNVGGLWVLGPFVERAFGRVRFSLIYLFSGCAGTAVYLGLFMTGRQHDPDLTLVGASGCVMGLLGATGAVMLRAWLRHRVEVARRIFIRLLFVVALQVVFDASTPQVAGLAHIVGLLGGFLSALLLSDRASIRRAALAAG